jgi:hypothetical protein
MLTALISINLALAFILELAMLASFAYWGFLTGESTVVKILLGIGIPLLVTVFWGNFMAPKSSRRLQGVVYLVVKVVLFSLAVKALIAAGLPDAGIALAVLFFFNTILLYVWQ